MKHDASTYRNNGCRCEICRADHAQLTKARRAARAERLKLDPTLVPHGKSTTYTNWMCRCPLCTEAHRVQRSLYVQGGA